MAATKFKIESGVQLLARLIKKAEVENFYTDLFQPGLRSDDVVEIFGSISFSTILIDVISEALLPKQMNEKPLGVLLFNTVGQFNYTDLINTMRAKIESFKYTNEDCLIDKENILQKALSNLFILEIYDATQMYATIYNLDNILANKQSISLLIVDTLTAFYWSEQGFKISKMDSYIKNLLKMIQKVSKEYKLIFMYTRPGYFGSSKDSDNLETCEVQVSEGVNITVQLLDKNSTGVYQVNVKTVDSYYKKCFCILDNGIKWQ
ncbi:DNA repair protein XRCC2-like [Trichoplusia ni]|uniref:DNA repair protein XRCC2-like n=1 Tax=Trichoplusia ni TaxID=7111 RepID=A0A7E5VBX6_TRINI|nr:DNA repair protein XRCC2-like [Trichoplusia ni]